MRNQNQYRIQDSPEYIIVKRITNEENRKNIIEALKSFAILLAAFFISVWVFTNFLLHIETIIDWWNNFHIEIFLIDMIIWLKKIIS
tara:strand:+ start:1304 stop:1564 length:261 start_codon:yes stop_codon:yes gene_type:complete